MARLIFKLDPLVLSGEVDDRYVFIASAVPENEEAQALSDAHDGGVPRVVTSASKRLYDSPEQENVIQVMRRSCRKMVACILEKEPGVDDYLVR